MIGRESVFDPHVWRDWLPVLAVRNFDVPFHPIQNWFINRCSSEVDGLPAEGTFWRLVSNAVQALSADSMLVGADQSGCPPPPAVLVEADGALPALLHAAFIPHFYFKNYTYVPGIRILNLEYLIMTDDFTQIMTKCWP